MGEVDQPTRRLDEEGKDGAAGMYGVECERLKGTFGERDGWLLGMGWCRTLED